MTKKKLIFVPQTSIGRIVLFTFLIQPVFKKLWHFSETPSDSPHRYTGLAIDLILGVVSTYLFVCLIRAILVATKVIKPKPLASESVELEGNELQ